LRIAAWTGDARDTRPFAVIPRFRVGGLIGYANAVLMARAIRRFLLVDRIGVSQVQNLASTPRAWEIV